MVIFQPFVDKCRQQKTLNLKPCVSPAEVKQSSSLPSYFSSNTINKCPIHDLLSATFFSLLYFLLEISQFKMTPKHSVKVLSSVPKLEKAVMNLLGKIYMFRKASLRHELWRCWS